MPLTPHDEYYHKMRDKAHDKMARVTGHEADDDDDPRRLTPWLRVFHGAGPSHPHTDSPRRMA